MDRVTQREASVRTPKHRSNSNPIRMLLYALRSDCVLKSLKARLAALFMQRVNAFGTEIMSGSPHK